MADPLASLSLLLSDVILPNLRAVQQSQAEQIAANDRLEHTIDDLRTHLESQFAQLSAQLLACQADLAATQAALKASQVAAGLQSPNSKRLVH